MLNKWTYTTLGASIRKIIIKGPFKHLNDQFPYPFIYLNLWNPYPFLYLKPEKGTPPRIGHYREYSPGPWPLWCRCTGYTNWTIMLASWKLVTLNLILDFNFTTAKVVYINVMINHAFIRKELFGDSLISDCLDLPSKRVLSFYKAHTTLHRSRL